MQREVERELNRRLRNQFRNIENIDAENAEGAGIAVANNVMNYIEPYERHDDEIIGNQNRELEELRQQLADRDTIIRELTQHNSRMAKKLHDIEWYEWLGDLATRTTNAVAICLIADRVVLKRFLTKHLMSSLQVEISAFSKNVRVGVLAGGAISVIGVISFAFWTYRTEKKKDRILAFFEGFKKGVENSVYALYYQRLTQKVIEYIDLLHVDDT